MKKHTQKMLIAGMLVSAAMSVQVMPAFAAAVPGAMHTAEELAHLSDNNLEWYEINDLISEYNAAVVKNRNEWNTNETKTYNAAELRDYLLDRADEMENQADQMAETSAMLYATYKNSADSMRLQAESSTSDFEVIQMEYKLIEKQTAASARSAFLNYYASLYEKEYADANLVYLDRVYNSTANRKNVGMATEIELLTAKENLDAARAGLLTTEANIGSYKNGLLVMCGWKYDSDGVICELPAMSVEEALAVNYETDKSTARSNNITLKMDEKKLNNAKNGNYTSLVVEQNQNQFNNDENSFGINFKSAYDGLVNACTAYTNAINDKAVGAQSLAAAESQFNLGMISAVELEGSRNSARALDLAEKKAYISMIQARAKYDDAVAGNI